MNNADVYAALSTIFREVFSRDDITLSPGMTANDLDGWDSFKQVDIIMAVEDRFGIMLNSDEMERLLSVGDLVSVIEAKI